MPVAAEADATLEAADGTLRFSGALTRAHVAGLWRQAPGERSAQVLDLAAVDSIDSAGLALLARLAAPGAQLLGNPPGLAELRAAYRLDESLGFAGG